MSKLSTWLIIIGTAVFAKFGFVGLVEEEWLATLATLDQEDVTYLDFVSEGRKLAKQLKEKVWIMIDEFIVKYSIS